MAEKAFTKLARFYDAIYADKDYEKEAMAIIRKTENCSAILDVGCGTGGHLAYFNKHYARAVGIEPSKEMASAAKLNGLEVVETKIELKQCTKLGKFDLIVSMFDVLDYILPLNLYNDAMRNINKMLSLGGKLYIEGWNAEKIDTVFEPTRCKVFTFMNKNGIRVATTKKNQEIYHVEFDYFWNGIHFSELHEMRPRLTTVPCLTQYGFALDSADSDDFSVHAWFTKTAEISTTSNAKPGGYSNNYEN